MSDWTHIFDGASWPETTSGRHIGARCARFRSNSPTSPTTSTRRTTPRERRGERAVPRSAPDILETLGLDLTSTGTYHAVGARFGGRNGSGQVAPRRSRRARQMRFPQREATGREARPGMNAEQAAGRLLRVGPRPGHVIQVDVRVEMSWACETVFRPFRGIGGMAQVAPMREPGVTDKDAVMTPILVPDEDGEARSATSLSGGDAMRARHHARAPPSVLLTFFLGIALARRGSSCSARTRTAASRRRSTACRARAASTPSRRSRAALAAVQRRRCSTSSSPRWSRSP